MGFLTYGSAAVKLYREIKTQKQFTQEFLAPYLHELELKHNGRFAPEQKEKILRYYGLFITSFLCSNYKKLYGKTLSPDERKRATLFGILTPVGDDLFDIEQLGIESIRHLTFDPDSYVAGSFAAKVAKEIQSFELRHVPNRPEYLASSKKVLEIQIETIRQTDSSISSAELEHITYTKGAESVIIYHQVLDDAASDKMKEALFLVGSLFQLGNDTFDLYKDVRDRIFTLINTCDDFTAFRIQFLERVALQNKSIRELPYQEKNKQEFCILMNAINARTMVALDQFIRLQKKLNGKIDWWKLQRKDMICDMEKAANISRWMYYIIKLNRL